MRTNTDCAQLFFVFTGKGPGIAGVPPLAVLKAMDILDRNIAMFRDLRARCYEQGVSVQIPTMEAFLTWQGHVRRRYRHTKHLYCLGTSAGGYAALLSAHELGAEIAWALAPALHDHEDGPLADRRRREVIERLQTWNGKTRYQVFYNESHPRDRENAEHLAALPSVEVFPQDGTGHVVMEHLYHTGRLATLTPPFVST